MEKHGDINPAYTPPGPEGAEGPRPHARVKEAADVLRARLEDGVQRRLADRVGARLKDKSESE